MHPAALRRRRTPVPGLHRPWFQANGFTRTRPDRFWRKVKRLADPALGRHADNMHDMALAGRARHHVLTTDQVRELLALHASGTPVRQLKARYGITQKAVNYITRRRSYAHLPPATLTGGNA